MRCSQLRCHFHSELARSFLETLPSVFGGLVTSLTFAHYGGLNKNGSHRLIGSGTIWRCGLIGEGATLLEEVCH